MLAVPLGVTQMLTKRPIGEEAYLPLTMEH